MTNELRRSHEDQGRDECPREVEKREPARHFGIADRAAAAPSLKKKCADDTSPNSIHAIAVMAAAIPAFTSVGVDGPKSRPIPELVESESLYW